MKQSHGRFVRTRGYIALRIIALMVLLTARSPLEGALLGSGEVNGGLRGVGDFDEILTVLAIDTFSGPFCFTSPTGCIELVGGRFGVADAGSVFALRPSVTSNFAEIVAMRLLLSSSVLKVTVATPSVEVVSEADESVPLSALKVTVSPATAALLESFTVARTVTVPTPSVASVGESTVRGIFAPFDTTVLPPSDEVDEQVVFASGLQDPSPPPPPPHAARKPTATTTPKRWINDLNIHAP